MGLLNKSKQKIKKGLKLCCKTSSGGTGLDVRWDSIKNLDAAKDEAQLLVVSRCERGPEL